MGAYQNYRIVGFFGLNFNFSTNQFCFLSNSVCFAYQVQ